MLITHLKPSELWGKKVYDVNGNFLGEVVAIASRRGVVRKVVVKRALLGGGGGAERPHHFLAGFRTQAHLGEGSGRLNRC